MITVRMRPLKRVACVGWFDRLGSSQMKRCRISPQAFVVNLYLVVLVLAQVICIDDGHADV